MKILVLSLLRLGDVAISAPAIRGLRARYPEAEIWLAINKSSAAIAPLLPYVDRVHSLDRADLQDALVQAERPMFEAYESLRAWTNELAQEKFDLCCNLTHTRFSGWIAGLVGAREVVGLSIDDAGRPSISTRWMQEINDRADVFDPDAFHFSDAFALAVDVDRDGEPFSLVESARGRAEADSALAGVCGPFLAVQALTSDEKKNWGLGRFERALVTFAHHHTETEIVLLGAEFEREQLENLSRGLEVAGVRSRLAIVGVEGLYSILRRAHTLLSGDTAAVHFAAAARVPCLQISIGSSDWRRTGAGSNGSLILQARERCAPCPHSSPCSRSSHACAERIPEDAVGVMASALFSRDFVRAAHEAKPFADEIDVLRTRRTALGVWVAEPVAPRSVSLRAAELLDLASRIMRLSGHSTTSGIAAPFGTLGRRLARELMHDANNSSGVARQAFEALCNEERAALSIAERAEAVADQASRLRVLRDDLASVAHRLGLARLADRALNPFDPMGGASEFTRRRLIRSAAAEIRERAAIGARIARAAAGFCHERRGEWPAKIDREEIK